MDITKTLGVLKKGRTTSEFVAMVIAGLFAGLSSLGMLDISKETIDSVATGVGEAVSTYQASKTGSVSVIDGLIRIVGLIVGGNVVSSYIKSRGDAKSSQALAVAKSLLLQAEKEQLKLDEPKKEVLNE